MPALFLILLSREYFLILCFEAQEEIIDSGGQIEPPGMHMIYLPYSDDIRPIEEARINPRSIVMMLVLLWHFKLSSCIYCKHDYTLLSGN